MNLLLRKTPDRRQPNRRDFMVQSTAASLGLTSVVNTLSQLTLVGTAAADNSPADYKALVCIFLNGGNDSNNLLIPTGGTARSHYETGRGVPQYAGGGGGLAIPLDELVNTALVPDNPTAFDPSPGYTNSSFALHPGCAHMKSIFDAGDLAFVSNVGTLSQPGITRANFNTVPSSSKPPQLFSHSDQQVQWQSSIPDKPFTSGWGGRLADMLHASSNAANPDYMGLSMGVSVAGVNSFQVGVNNQPYVMSSTGVADFDGFGPSNVGYADALNSTASRPFVNYDPLNPGSTYKTGHQGWRLRALEQLLAMNHANLFDASYAATKKNARITEGTVGGALVQTDGSNTGSNASIDSYFTNAFAGTGISANNDFTNQLKMVARLILGSGGLGNHRQVFFVQQTGYDTHTSQIATTGTPAAPRTDQGQYVLLATLSCAIKGFYDAINNHSAGGAALWNKVVAFSASDFTRTLTPNKTDSTGGSDHAWGGHAFVLGGAVQGKKIYGTFPLLQVNGGIDCTGNRGRWIPSTSVDQYTAKIAEWMGVPNSSLSTIFPNLSRFGAGTNLSFL